MDQKEGQSRYIRWFAELTNKDVPIAGGKGASLGEMYSNKFPVPPGFVIITPGYKRLIEANELNEKLKGIIESLDVDNTDELNKASAEIRQIIDNANVPDDLKTEIIEAYDILDVDKKGYADAKGNALTILKNSHEPPFVAVRSSATTEDLVDASFAGQQDTFLNVKGNDDLIDKFKKCCSSLFTPRAIYYRKKKGFAYDQAFLAVVVQKMIDSTKSGVMFSRNPLKDDGTIIVEAVFGLGEGIVSGRVSPDHYVLNKEYQIIDKIIASKEVAIIRTSSGANDIVKLGDDKRTQQVLTNSETIRLAQLAVALEEHYKKPQDIEFAVDNEGVYIVQSRPITTKAIKADKEVEGNVLLSGSPASPGIASGTVRIIKDLAELGKVKKGDVLVTTMTNPDMVVSMQRAAAIVTDEGGMTSHAAIVSREMGIPAVVGTKNATSVLQEGKVITVDGNTGRIIEGQGIEKKVEIKPIVPTRTKIKVIVDLPDYAERAAESKSDSVGLVRLEGIIAMSGKHPIYFVKKGDMKGYIDIVHSGLKKLSMPFKSVWIRTSDIRSDEYRNLEGAPQDIEGNPMLGDHGIRFSLKNIDILESEIKAIKELADEFPAKEFGIMAPQIISVEEVKGLKKIASEVGLPENVKIGIMVETPAAVQIIDDLCREGIQFISFGTNDLTQYTLAIDRNNENVQDLYTEMHPAVLRSLGHVIQTCKTHGVTTSICGQAASKPEMAKFLVGHGIDSLSVNADAALKVSEVVAEIEKSMPAFSNDESEPGAIAVSPDTQDENKNGESMENNDSLADEEQVILSALESPGAEPEDEYNPGFSGMDEGKESIPELNNAIPISDEDLSIVIEQTQEIVFENQQDAHLGRQILQEMGVGEYSGSEWKIKRKN